MMLIKYLCFIFAFTVCTYAVKVDMSGSISLGTEVLNVLNSFFRRAGGIQQSGRRSMYDQADSISMEVISSALCHKAQFCTGPLYQFVNEYVIVLAKIAESVFEGIHDIQAEVKLEAATPIFGKLKGCLREIRKFIKSASEKVNDTNDVYIWVSVIKKICATFHAKTISYIEDKLKTDTTHDQIKKNLTQQLVIKFAEIEGHYQKKLCHDHRICLKSLECTKSLNNILERLIVLPDTKMKSFIRSLYELLPETSFYNHLSSVTANEFQVILNDMAFAEHVPSKDILVTVQKIVANRLYTAYRKEETTNLGQDTTLVHAILSDMDFFYSKMKPEPFKSFFSEFIDWTRSGGRVNKFLKDAILSIQHILHGVSEQLIAKLTFQVRVFLELTVDPEEAHV